MPCAEAHVCPAGDGLGGSRCHERLLLKAVVYLPLGIVCCLPLLRREPKSAKGILLADLASGLLLIVCIVFILSSSYNPFIYFRF